jgi:AcrR family transcriptional regulator
LAYHYATRNGLAELSLRPLAVAVGSSPRVLLFLFGSKDHLLRAVLARARQDQLTLLQRMRTESAPADLSAAVRSLWRWLAELAMAQPPARRRSRVGTAERTLALAVMRGVLLDLLATGDHERTTAAMEYHLKTTVRTG